MRFMALLFVLACFGFQLYYDGEHDRVTSAVYSVGAMVIASILACTSRQR